MWVHYPPSRGSHRPAPLRAAELEAKGTGHGVKLGVYLRLRVAHCPQQPSVVSNGRLQMRVWMAGGTGSVEEYLHHAPTQRFGLGQAVGGREQ